MRLNAYLTLFNDSHFESAKKFESDEEVMVLYNGDSSREMLFRIIEGYRKCHELTVYWYTPKKI